MTPSRTLHGRLFLPSQGVATPSNQNVAFGEIVNQPQSPDQPGQIPSAIHILLEPGRPSQLRTASQSPPGLPCSLSSSGAFTSCPFSPSPLSSSSHEPWNVLGSSHLPAARRQTLLGPTRSTLRSAAYRQYSSRGPVALRYDSSRSEWKRTDVQFYHDGRHR